jgi:hypothetical protein
MGSRTLPIECHHGRVVDWGDFGPCQGYCYENGHSSSKCPDYEPCPDCEREVAEATARIEAHEAEHVRLRDENERLRPAIAAAIRELQAGHYPEWASEEAKAAGKEPLWCAICGAADGGWPCLSAEVANDLALALSGSKVVDDQ